MNMNTFRAWRVVLLFIGFFISSCAYSQTPTPFRPPTEAPPATIPLAAATFPLAVSPTSVVTNEATDSLPCTNDLTFVQDLTIPDGTIVNPSQPVDKQWLI